MKASNVIKYALMILQWFKRVTLVGCCVLTDSTGRFSSSSCVRPYTIGKFSLLIWVNSDITGKFSTSSCVRSDKTGSVSTSICFRHNTTWNIPVASGLTDSYWLVWLAEIPHITSRQTGVQLDFFILAFVHCSSWLERGEGTPHSNNVSSRGLEAAVLPPPGSAGRRAASPCIGALVSYPAVCSLFVESPSRWLQYIFYRPPSPPAVLRECTNSAAVTAHKIPKPFKKLRMFFDRALPANYVQEIQFNT
jgi:hypothetical protein